MERGFKAVQELLADESFAPADVSKLLLKFGTTMMSTMGGASGAIFGTLFRSGAKAIKGANELNTQVLSEFLAAGLQGVYERGGAAPGDKTMIDALVAAVKESESRQGELSEHLQQLLLQRKLG